MSIDADFLAKLRCPRTRKRLRPLTAAERDALNEAIGRGRVRTHGGRAVDQPIAEGLVPEGESFVYPVDDGIPILLGDEAIPITGSDGSRAE